MSVNAQSSNERKRSPLTREERQYQRVELSLFGRYMLADKREFPCQIVNMSPGSAAVIGPRSGDIGETVIAYMDHVGRIEGKILRIFHGGFAMNINATPQKRDKLSAKITWLANRHELNLPEDRRHERIVPSRKAAEIKLEDGRSYNAKIIDLSLSGAAIEMDVRPAIGTLMWLGSMRGRVVRHFDEGVAIEFAILQNHDSLRQFTAGG
ncbi:MAG: PilZ domain-containing protein, partial [Pseudomonadota bacterium]